MAMIYVKTRPGRRAYYEGRAIPDDKFTPVNDTPYIRRLITHWEDLELEAGSEVNKKGRVTEDKQGQDDKPRSPMRPTAPRPESPTE